MPTAGNRLYYGDNLDVLRQHLHPESVDLIYLDPPFNSNRSYNVLFKTQAGLESAAQQQAFDDTWHWSPPTQQLFEELAFSGGANPQVAETIRAMHKMLGQNDVFAYLVMMTARLVELHRVLKPTGSLYLHCDSTASHYLKVILDAVFGVRNFRNEIIWKRRVGMSSAVHESTRFGTITDTIFLYARSDAAEFHPQYNLSDPEYQRYITERFTLVDPDGRRFQATSLTNPSRRPNLTYEYKGYQPPANGWMISREKMEQWDAEGRIYFPKNKTQRLRRKSYADELRGMPVQNLWLDIQEINSQAAERLGYPTQKPLALLERIIAASSNEGDIVLDPFCGCGTAVDAAQKLRRQWIGIDITYLAVDLIQKRLRHTYGDMAAYDVYGIPADIQGAQRLFESNAFDFERWAVSLVDGWPNQRQVGDRGIDGVIEFSADDAQRTGRALVSVKGGRQLNPAMVRDLVGTVEREKAEIGIFISLGDPTRGMKDEAAHSGSYTNKFTGQSYPKVQLLTVPELLAGKRPKMPTVLLPYVQARSRGPENLSLFS